MQAFPFDSELTYDEYNNPIYDRAVSSQPLRKLIKELFTTGVMPNPSTNLQVSAGSDGMTVQIAAGFAVIDGGLCRETEIRTLEVTAADNTYDRIDTVVLRWNENVDVRTADLYVVAGTPAVNPVRPTLQRNNSIYEIGLADVFITKRVATITNDKITDTRYEAERCGIVSSISEFDTTTLYQQVQADLTGFKTTEQAEFMSWFDNIQSILDENAAGHLQNEIDGLTGRVSAAEDTIEQINTDLSVFSFRNNEGQAQYSMDNGTTWKDFKHPAGTLSITANGTYNVADYASAKVAVPAFISVSGARNSSVVKGNQSCSISVTNGKAYALFCMAAACIADDSDTTAFNTGFTGCTILINTSTINEMGEGGEWATGRLYVVRATSSYITWKAGNRDGQKRVLFAIQLD